MCGVLPALLLIVLAPGRASTTAVPDDPWPPGWIRYAPTGEGYEVALPAPPEPDPWRPGALHARADPQSPTFGIYQHAEAHDTDQAIGRLVTLFDTGPPGAPVNVRSHDGSEGAAFELRPAAGGTLRARVFRRQQGAICFYVYSSTNEESQPVGQQSFFDSIRFEVTPNP